MKILVTGGCGFIGTNLVRYLLTRTNHSVVNVDKLTYAANRGSFTDWEGRSRYQFVQADIADSNSVAAVFNSADPDAIVHLAAESHVDRSIDGPSEFVQTNVVGTFNLLDAAKRRFDDFDDRRKAIFRFLHVSTDEVYGTLGDTGRFTESTRYDPHSPYAATKAASDHLARSWHTTYGLPVIVTNCSNNYGPYQFPEKLIPLMIIKCIAGEPLPIYGQGLNVRDWLHVDDHVNALVTVLKAGVPGETYNIGGDCELRNVELVTQVCRLMDTLRPSESGRSYCENLKYVSDRPGHDFRYAIDATKLQTELGWQAKHSIDTGLRATVQWYLDNETWWRPILDKNYQLQRLGDTSGDSSLGTAASAEHYE
ncbi:MAG: dTDP-glucose 4,6-dehydratase [Pirellulaceae bacterium]